MHKYFLPILAALALIFAGWQYQRDQIWENSGVSPSETVLKFMENRAFFIMALRAAALAMWGWGVFLLWRSNAARYVWWAALFYVGFNGIEFIVLEEYFYNYKVQHELWEGGFALAWMEAAFILFTVLIFNAFAVWLIRYWRRKNLERQP